MTLRVAMIAGLCAALALPAYMWLGRDSSRPSGVSFPPESLEILVDQDADRVMVLAYPARDKPGIVERDGIVSITDTGGRLVGTLRVVEAPVAALLAEPGFALIIGYGPLGEHGLPIGPGAVDVIDLRRAERVASVPVAIRPQQVIFDKARHLAVVLSTQGSFTTPGAGVATVIDTTSWEPIAHLEVAVANSPSVGFLDERNALRILGPDEVTVLDLDRQSIALKFPLGEENERVVGDASYDAASGRLTVLMLPQRTNTGGLGAQDGDILLYDERSLVGSVRISEPRRMVLSPEDGLAIVAAADAVVAVTLRTGEVEWVAPIPAGVEHSPRLQLLSRSRLAILSDETVSLLSVRDGGELCKAYWDAVPGAVTFDANKDAMLGVPISGGEILTLQMCER